MTIALVIHSQVVLEQTIDVDDTNAVIDELFWGAVILLRVIDDNISQIKVLFHATGKKACSNKLGIVL